MARFLLYGGTFCSITGMLNPVCFYGTGVWCIVISNCVLSYDVVGAGRSGWEVVEVLGSSHSHSNCCCRFPASSVKNGGFIDSASNICCLNM